MASRVVGRGAFQRGLFGLNQISKTKLQGVNGSFRSGVRPMLRSSAYSTSCLSGFKSDLSVISFSRSYASVSVPVPEMGDSISEGTLGEWTKQKGDYVAVDDVVCTIETDKITNDIMAPVAGTITELLVSQGDTVVVGQDLFSIDEGVGEPKKQDTPKAAAEPEKKAEKAQPQAPKKEEAPKKQETSASSSQPAPRFAAGTERRVPMTRMRQRISERLKDSQNTYAMLTTFQECDMHNLMQMRNEFKDAFLEKHGVKLGFMSAFVKASAAALIETPEVNAVIDGTDILYRDFVDISVAVATPKGLVTPVLRDCDKMSFADVEKEIQALGERARKGKISLEDLSGGTFTISNGGVYGSLMGTPIINPPQSAILGMHAINNRATVVGKEILIRPIMYLALTYDHRLIDGREAVTFLRKIKFGIEDPRRLLLDL